MEQRAVTVARERRGPAYQLGVPAPRKPEMRPAKPWGHGTATRVGLEWKRGLESVGVAVDRPDAEDSGVARAEKSGSRGGGLPALPDAIGAV